MVLSGCATLFSDSDDTITVKSEPSGALVFLNEEEKGRTPISFKLKRDTFKESSIRLQKKGFKNKKILVKKTLNSTSLFNLLSVSSWATDAISGKMIVYSPNHYFATLDQKDKVTTLPGIAPFVISSHMKLLQDFVRGQGEYLKTFSKLKNLSEEKILKTVKPRLKEIIEITDAVDFYRYIESLFT